MIPVEDRDGSVVQLYGRKVRDDLRAGTLAHLYLPGPRRGVFNHQALTAAAGELVVCESLIDALTFWAHGHRHVTAAYGADGFTDEHHAALRDAGVERVLIAYDCDEAGDRGAAKLAQRLGGGGIECFRVLFPAGLDANAFAASVEDPADALGELLGAAVEDRRGAGPGADRCGRGGRFGAPGRRGRAGGVGVPDPFPAAKPRPAPVSPSVQAGGGACRRRAARRDRWAPLAGAGSWAGDVV